MPSRWCRVVAGAVGIGLASCALVAHVFLQVAPRTGAVLTTHHKVSNVSHDHKDVKGTVQDKQDYASSQHLEVVSAAAAEAKAKAKAEAAAAEAKAKAEARAKAEAKQMSTGKCIVDVDSLHSQTALNRDQRRSLIYSPAAWEVDFVTNMSKYQSNDTNWKVGCSRMQRYRPLVDEWLRAEKAQRSKAPTQFSKDALSYFTTTTSPPGKLPQTITAPIEPLVGFLRHPLSVCFDAGQYLIDKSYLLLGAPESVGTARRYFFDVGASQYNSGAGGASQSWFVNQYKKVLGVSFDRIIAWEYSGVQAERLRETPFDVLAKTSYFVIPASAELDSCHNPMNFIRQLCKPEDFCVLKIDMDTPKVESPLVEQLLADANLAGLIDEFFYEDHVHKSPMEHRGWGLKEKDHDLAKSISIFARLREMGVRAHSWV